MLNSLVWLILKTETHTNGPKWANPRYNPLTLAPLEYPLQPLRRGFLLPANSCAAPGGGALHLRGGVNNTADLVQGLLASGVSAAAPAEQSAVQTAQSAYRSLVSDLWSPAAQARAIVWGLPMIVFALIAAISQR